MEYPLVVLAFLVYHGALLLVIQKIADATCRCPRKEE